MTYRISLGLCLPTNTPPLASDFSLLRSHWHFIIAYATEPYCFTAPANAPTLLASK